LAMEHLFKLAQWLNILIARVGLGHCRRIPITLIARPRQSGFISSNPRQLGCTNCQIAVWNR
jgi:hypothetical protein